MLLFITSFIMVFASAYLAASALRRDRDGLIYFLLIAFANVVLTFEVLSLFNAISQAGVLGMNAFLLAAAGFWWYKAGKPLWAPKLSFKKFFNALKLDKYLAVLFVGYVVLIATSVFLMSFMPVVNADASAYHILRSVFWVQNGNLNHFMVADIRNLVMPINSEILYAWIILFVQKIVWVGFVSFAGYILAMVSLYKLMDFMSMRKKLWVIFLTSSFPAVIVGMSGTETDIIIAGLILASLVLFKRGGGKCTEKTDARNSGGNVELFFAALAYALAIGTKTPAIMAIPAVGLAMLAMCYCRRNYKPLLKFIGFGVVNFALFGAYNYVLNFIDYGNIAGSQAFLLAHKNRYGLAAIPANFIKYIFQFFDFTGWRWGSLIEPEFLALRENILKFLHLDFVFDGLYTTKPLNQSLLEPLMGLGILGFIMFLPCWIWAGVKGLLPRRNRQTAILFAFALMLLVNILVMSYQIQFMMFSIRFLAAFCVISAPVIAYSYCKKNNPYKFIVVCFAMFALVLVSTSLWARPFRRVITYIKAGYNVRQLREVAVCSGFRKEAGNPAKINPQEIFFDTPCLLRNYIRERYTKDDRILFFTGTGGEILMLKMLNFRGYQIDFGLMEDIDNIDLSRYNVIVTTDNGQKSTNVVRWEDRKNDIYFNPDDKSMHILKNIERPCYYLSNNEAIIGEPNNPKSAPYATECVLSSKFFKQHGLKREGKITVTVFPNLEKEKIVNYLFYSNKSLR